MKRILLTGCLCALLVSALVVPAWADLAAEAAPEEGICCFSREELAGRPALDGVFVTAAPEAGTARVCLGGRILRAGDAVSREDLARLRVEPAAGGEAALCFLPVEDGRLGEETVLTFHLERVEDKGPVALPEELETWRNLPNTGKLRAEGAGDGVPGENVEGLTVHVEPSSLPKCLRCWTRSETVGSDPEHPELCARCAAAIR